MRIPNKPTWTVGPALPRYPRLREDLETDVAVIGGGLAGVLTAYELGRAGKRVILLEADRIASGATSRTTAFLTQYIDSSVTEQLGIYGKRDTRLIWESHGEAIGYVEAVAQREKIPCEFARCPIYIYARDLDELTALAEEQDALRQINVPAMLRKGGGALGFPHAGYLEVKNQARFHPLKLIAGLLPRIEAQGGTIFEQSAVTSVEGDGPFAVRVGDRVVRAAQTVTATYEPFDNPVQTFAKKGMYVSYVFELLVPRGLLKPALYQDLANPYHYFRVDPGDGYDRVIVGGEDHRKILPVNHQNHYRALRAYVDRLLDGNHYEIVRRWSGPILEPSDGLALIGAVKPGRLLASAFSGNGMTYSGIAAQLLRDLVLGKQNRFQRLYDPTRPLTPKRLARKFLDYAEEFFGGAVKDAFSE